MGLVERRLVGGERTRVDADEATTGLEKTVGALRESVNHFTGGGVVEQERCRDDIEGALELVEEGRLASVSTVELCFAGGSRVFLAFGKLDHVLGDVDADDSPRGQLAEESRVEAFATSQIADVFIAEVAPEQIHQGGCLRFGSERKHFGLLVLFRDVRILVFAFKTILLLCLKHVIF